MLMTVQPCFLRLFIEFLREGAHLGIGKSLGRPVGVFTLVIIVQHQHCEPRPIARFGVFQHLSVAGRIAESGIGPKPDHEVDALGFAGVVVVEQQLGVLGQERFAVLVIAVATGPSIALPNLKGNII